MRQKAAASAARASAPPVQAASPAANAPSGSAASAAAGTLKPDEWGYAQSGRATTPHAAAGADGDDAAAARERALEEARAGYAGVTSATAAGESGQISAAQQAALDRLNKVRGVPPAAPAAQGPVREPGIPMPPKPGAESRPPLRKPVGMSTWALAAILLGVIWFLAKPSDPHKKLESRVEKVIGYTGECKIDQARAEQASLKADKASAAQLKRVQEAINGAAPGCEKKRQRGKAWTELRPALEDALHTGAYERAASRLAAFVKRWGQDDDTSDWDKRIDIKLGERLLDEADACLKKSDRNCVEAKLQAIMKLNRTELGPRTQALHESLSRLLEATILEQKAPAAAGATAAPATAAARAAPAAAQAQAPARTSPAAPPANVISTAPQTAQAAQQARKILADAERELSQGNYKGAMDKAEICATMIDVGNRECLGLKQRAERLNREMLRCVASGADWINDRCQ
ncbi:hypothetical protein SAMN05216552_1002122 [Pseudoduganella namucuonensis]|uniref:Uncharacterized protein n=2 Tax=Pseudoduganella namucuonensis TaxID=1035707 RepID=A0A1I7FL54_9BURK|nr:hypothetical protein SAMN05216552_1002122 [Pseudoduganella namucuonensis]